MDKVELRESLRAVRKLLVGLPLPDRQFLCFATIAVLVDRAIPVYVTEETRQILLRSHIAQVAQVWSPSLRVLAPGRYLRRWARRLREESFGREDGVIVSYGSFGIDVTRETFGAEAILTTDYSLKTRFEQLRPHLTRRFERMTCQLAAPYAMSALPEIVSPEELLERCIG
jgi:hypothetical protein